MAREVQRRMDDSIGGRRRHRSESEDVDEAESVRRRTETIRGRETTVSGGGERGAAEEMRAEMSERAAAIFGSLSERSGRRGKL